MYLVIKNNLYAKSACVALVTDQRILQHNVHDVVIWVPCGPQHEHGDFGMQQGSWGLVQLRVFLLSWNS